MVDPARVPSSASDAESDTASGAAYARGRELRNRQLRGIAIGVGATVAVMALVTSVWVFSNPDAKTRVSVSEPVASPMPIPVAVEPSPIVPTPVIDTGRRMLIRTGDGSN
jgi:hypothetical protein